MKKEYVGSVGLIILGHDLVPTLVSKALGMRPNQSWLRGQAQTSGKLEFKSKYKWGGWKKYPPKGVGNKPIEEQLRYWISLLKSKQKMLNKFRKDGYVTYLTVFAATDSTVSMVWSPKLVRALGDLELELQFSVFVS